MPRPPHPRRLPRRPPLRPLPLPPRLLRPTLRRKLADAGRIAVLGVGSELRGDDAAGTLVARRLGVLAARSRRLAVCLGYTAPENFTGPIGRHLAAAPEGRRALVLVDAADLGRRPGAVVLLEREQIGGVTFSTHQLPLALLVDYIARAVPHRVYVLAIQPASTAFGAHVSAPVRRAAGRVAAALHAVTRAPAPRRAGRCGVHAGLA